MTYRSSWKPRKKGRPEDKLCRDFVKAVEDMILYGQIIKPASFQYWYTPNGQVAGGDNLARIIAGKRDKLMGAMKGVPDYTFHWRDSEDTPFVGYMDAKSKNGELTKEQERFRSWCITEHIPFAEFRSVQEALKLLQRWGVIKAGAII